MRNDEKKQNNKGFSLVELIIVITIMAVLVAILAPAFMRYVEATKQESDITAVDEVITAAKAAYTNSEWTISGSSVTIEMTTAGTSTSNTQLETALKASAAYGSDAKLKSSKWGPNIIITLEEATGGAVGALNATVNSTGKVKIQDKYNKK